MNKKINKIYLIKWLDASYSFNKKMPNFNPPLSVTTGFIFKETKDYLLISTNSAVFSKGEIDCVDGILIPKKVIFLKKVIHKI